jgi:[acyl-carrier-protein] S-malonyltransferase
MLVIAAPGQGAQTPGFLRPWLEFPGVEELIGGWSELIGCDLIRYGTAGDADEIRDTAVAQPLLVAAALAAAGVLGVTSKVTSGIVTGHSVGEIGAGAIGGVVSREDAMRLVGMRGRAMAEAAAIEPTSMTAVLGGDEAEVLASIERHGLTPANINGSGQIVAAGTVDQLARFAADPPPRAKLRPLQVAGAFHTTHMAPAVEALGEVAATVETHDPVLTVLSNADGAVVSTGADWLRRIVMQVSAPVRWDKCMAAMQERHATAFLELPPAGTLTALARRALPGVTLLALKTPAELDAATTLLAEHAGSSADTRTEERQ